MSIATKVAWSAWALVPVAVIAYHYGPGQRAYVEQKAQTLLKQAAVLEAKADDAQDAAYQWQLASLAARRAAATDRSPDTVARVKASAAEEDKAYAVAAAAWRETADALRSAQDLLTSCASPKAAPVRVARGRATIRSGAIAEGIDDLESMLDTVSAETPRSEALQRELREEIATGYYYGARLLRMNGKPTVEWREAAGVARQNFRYLAESTPPADGDKADSLQKNLELVLNLEQSPQEDLLAKPLPKNSPRCEGNCKNPGKKHTKRPPRKKGDDRGAGGVDDIEGGW